MIILKKQPYNFMPSDSGILVEIYLPKKSVFQGTLFNTLTEGFKIENVKNYFNCNKNKTKIKELLKNYNKVKDYSIDDIDNFPKLFFGYSLYEVDGVFCGENNKIYEEKTQVIKIIFKPNIDEFINNHKDEIELIRDTTRDFLSNRKNFNNFRNTLMLTSLQVEIVDYLQNWIDYIGLFIFGYIVHQICDRITELCSSGQMEWNDAEDEIWVTSLWNLHINRIVFNPS